MKNKICYAKQLKLKDKKRDLMKWYLLAGLAFLTYAAVSNMAFNDCINFGVC